MMPELLWADGSQMMESVSSQTACLAVTGIHMQPIPMQVMEEQPTAFNKVLLGFLKEHIAS